MPVVWVDFNYEVSMNDLKKPVEIGEKEAVPEKIVQKLNRNLPFDKEDYLSEHFNNYLTSVQRHEERVTGKIITKWDEFTSFDDWLKDSLATIEEKLHAISMAKEAQTQKFRLLDDSVLSEMKMDKSSVVGQRFGIEDYEAVEEMLKRGRDTINDYRAGRIQFVVDSNTGRSRVI
jgi:hypothetical protein